MPPRRSAPWHVEQLVRGLVRPGAWATPLLLTVWPSGAFAGAVELEQAERGRIRAKPNTTTPQEGHFIRDDIPKVLIREEGETTPTRSGLPS